MKHDPRGVPPYDDPAAIAADLAQERAALAQTMTELRNRLKPGAVLAEGASFLRSPSQGGSSILPKGAAPWIAGAAIAGLGITYLALRAKSEPEDVPQWLVEVRHARARADELIAQIDKAQIGRAHV